jgi:phosphoribosylformylglycinamidine cyclo-ligase
MSLTYEASGVDYDALDGFKRACQRAAASTVEALAARGVREPEGVRGESAYLIETEDAYLAHVEEGLGTKSLVADAVYASTGRSYRRSASTQWPRS